jgi:hypothetical protein
MKTLKALKASKAPKALVLGLTLACSSSAFAHGALAHQASEAIAKAAELFQTQPKETQRAFKSIAADLAGHELFNVTITLNDGATKFGYLCHENEEVDPVVWECQAQ